jgi:hypothetical protein
VGHVVDSSAFGAQNIDTYFLCSSGTAMDLTKSALGHVTPNFCFVHLMGSVTHIVHSAFPRARNVNPLFFMLMLT